MTKRFPLLLLAIILQCVLCPVWALTHSIAPGDTFESIAKKYGITSSQLRSRNPRVNECTVGLILEIPDPDASDYYRNGENAPGYKDYNLWKEYRYSKDKKSKKYAGVCLKMAYDAGYYDAVLDYAEILEYGKNGVKKDIVKSLSVLFTAASKDHADAKWEIFRKHKYFTHGDKYPASFPSDDVLMIWLHEAADGNVKDAVNSLAHHYLLGLQVEKDSVKAAALYEKSILLDPSETDINSGNWNYKNSIESLTKLRSHLKGNGQEAYNKGTSLVEKGKYDLAHIYFLKGSDLGDVKSMVSLAKDFETGRGTGKDDRKALQWYEAAAKKNDKSALASAESLKKKLAASAPKTVPTNQSSQAAVTSANSSSASSGQGNNRGNKFMDVLDKIGKVADAVGSTSSAINEIANSHTQTASSTSRTTQTVNDTSDDSDDRAAEAEKNRKIKERNKLYADCCHKYDDMVKAKMKLHSAYRDMNNEFLKVRDAYRKYNDPEMKALYNKAFKFCQDLRKEILDMEKRMRKFRRDCYEQYKVTVPFNALETKTPNFRQ